MQVKFFDPGKAYLKIKDEIDSEIQRVLTAGDLILRNDVEVFEKNLAKFVGTKYAVALNSGTDALYLALKAVGVGRDSFVAVPSHTFVATAQVVNQCGGEIELYDLEAQPFDNLDYYIVSHIAGELSILPNTDKPVIEDACQALGVVKNPTSDAQCWSFYPAKILGAYGDAGALTTNREDIYNYVKEARNHFKTDYKHWGVNSRMDNLQAAILNVKFKYLPEVLARRKQIAEMYSDSLLTVKNPKHSHGRVWQDYIVQCKSKELRDSLYEFLKEQGIETMKNEYPMPIAKLPQAEKYESETLRIPINEILTDQEINYVISKINEWANV